MFGRKKSRKNDKAAAPAVARRSIEMGMVDRLTSDWLGSDMTVNQMLFSQMAVIRRRARDLGLNSPWVRRFLSMARTNVVGSDGFALNVRAMQQDGSGLDKNGNKEVERLWKEWCRPENCTMSGRMSLIDVCNQSVTNLFQDGEFIIRMVVGAPNKFGFALTLLPVDLLDENLNRELKRNSSGQVIQTAIKLGIEVDEWDRPLFYHFRDAQDSPIGGGYGSLTQRHIIYPANEIIHVFPAERVGQSRGFSFTAPAGTRTKMLNAYEDAAVIHKRIAASKMGVIVPDAENPPPGDYNADGENADGSRKMEIEPGIWEKVPLGYKMDKFDVDDVSDGFSDFSKQILRSIASAFNVNFMSLANDPGDANYSSLRHFALEDRDVWKCIQRFLIEQLLNRMYGEWFKWTLTVGNTFIPIYRYEKFHQASAFQGRRWGWVDPLKEEKANETALKNRTTSRRRICQMQGVDYDDVQRELDEEQAALPSTTGEQV